MKNNLIKIDAPELLGIEKSKAEMIRTTFEPMTEMLSEFEGVFNAILKESKKEITPELSIQAKRLRLDIGKIRINTEKLRKEKKDESLREGKAIDGVSNILKWAVTEKENKLKEIENHAEILEQERLEKLQLERAEKLAKYVEDAFERDLSSMENDVWDAYYSSKKKAHEDRLEAEKQAEKERIEREEAEAKEREEIRKENERLKAEAEEREKLEKIEAEKRAKAEKERKAKEEAERLKREAEAKKEREAYEMKLKVEREERERVEREERAKREKLEAELKAKEEAESLELEKKEAELQSELSKGDSAKVVDLINDFEMIKTKYVFKSSKNKKMYEDVKLLIDKVIVHIK